MPELGFIPVAHRLFVNAPWQRLCWMEENANLMNRSAAVMVLVAGCGKKTVVGIGKAVLEDWWGVRHLEGCERHWQGMCTVAVRKLSGTWGVVGECAGSCL